MTAEVADEKKVLSCDVQKLKQIVDSFSEEEKKSKSVKELISRAERTIRTAKQLGL